MNKEQIENDLDAQIDNYIADQMKALKILYDNNLVGPFLMVLYITVDVLGHITGLAFDGFVKKYMLPRLPNITASDLWAARCALLHTNTPESKHVKKGQARRVSYAFGSAKLSMINEVITRFGDVENNVGVKIEDLYGSLVSGIALLRKDLKEKKQFSQYCSKRVEKFYVAIRRK